MNSVVRLSFNLTFAFFRTCGSREQCTGPTEKKAKCSNFHFSMQSKLNLGFKVFRTFILVFIFINLRSFWYLPSSYLWKNVYMTNGLYCLYSAFYKWKWQHKIWGSIPAHTKNWLVSWFGNKKLSLGGERHSVEQLNFSVQNKSNK